MIRKKQKRERLGKARSAFRLRGAEVEDSDIIRFQKRKKICEDDEMSDVRKRWSHKWCKSTTLTDLSSYAFKSELLHTHKGCSQPKLLSTSCYRPFVAYSRVQYPRPSDHKTLDMVS